MGTVRLSRGQVLAHRVRAQQLDREHGTLDDTAVLDLGVQDSGTDGGLWALAVRGLTEVPVERLVLLWSLRAAPHYYRRTDLGSVAAAVQPFSDADAGKRIYDAAKPLREAGVGNLEGLDEVAAAMRDLVRAPMQKGDVSAALTAVLPSWHLRGCVPCGATHPWEMPFRLAALRAGLELDPGTSPPVLRPVDVPAVDAPEPRHDVVRGYLHLLGPATPQAVAQFLDAPVKDVQARWPDDVVELEVEGERRWLLASDADVPDAPPDVVRLLGPYDLYLQLRDRPTLVADAARAKELWRAIGRPGAVLAGGEVAGTWRPRKKGRRLDVAVDLWTPVDRDALQAQAERLAAHRGVRLGAVEV